VTGVLTDRSLAYATAERMQQQGAEIVLTGFGRARRLTERAAQGLAGRPEVLELDVNDGSQLERIAADVDERWDALDGVFHSIAYAPPEVWGEPFLDVSHEALEATMRTSVYSLQALTGALAAQLERSPGGASVVGLTVLPGRVSRSYGWMHVVKGALDALVKTAAVELAPRGVRVNALALGPLRTNAATGIPGFAEIEGVFERAPLGWDSRDTSVVAGPACFLLSEQSRAITGEILHVDGGYHALL
jgi:enoyl-[acyl-carrier protein] reductase I